MLPLKKILCPYDYSAASDEILKASNELALHFSAELVVLYAIESMPVNKESMRRKLLVSMWNRSGRTGRRISHRLQESSIRKSPRIKVKSIVKYGEASNAIVEVAKEENADVIVMPFTRGKGGGSISSVPRYVAARVIDEFTVLRDKHTHFRIQVK